MKPHIRYGENGFRLYPPCTLRGEAATAFLRFSEDYFRALAKRYGEDARFRRGRDYLEADLSQAPRTLRAARMLLNPRHPAMSEVRVFQPQPLFLDPRLLR